MTSVRAIGPRLLSKVQSVHHIKLLHTTNAQRGCVGLFSIVGYLGHLRDPS